MSFFIVFLSHLSHFIFYTSTFRSPLCLFPFRSTYFRSFLIIIFYSPVSSLLFCSESFMYLCHPDSVSVPLFSFYVPFCLLFFYTLSPFLLSRLLFCFRFVSFSFCSGSFSAQLWLLHLFSNLSAFLFLLYFSVLRLLFCFVFLFFCQLFFLPVLLRLFGISSFFVFLFFYWCIIL